LSRLVSEGDLMRRLSEDENHWWLKIMLKDSVSAPDFIKAHGLKVKDVITRNIVSVKKNAEINEVAHVLDVNPIKPAPVVDGDKTVRIIKSF
tara:strand:- start:155 stop:430 length:276 start_codon:yes stop_codon:yes gene_type:complete